MNPFQYSYDHRLREWKKLRILIRGQSIQQACIEVDRWWQQVPLINHYLHPADITNWPDPWTILSENTYCRLTRAVGMCYTLLISDVHDIQLVEATDCQGEDHDLVLVSDAKYILNYHPNSVLSTTLSEFKIKNSLSLSHLKEKIR